MDEATRQQLLQINREFYARHAAAFAATRYGAQPGWERIIQHFPSRCQVLDLGCGNGRFAQFLDERLQQVRYLGLDGSEPLLRLARRRAADLARTQAAFALADLSQPGWEQAAGPDRFDVVVALAVLHHVPGQAHRAAFLAAAAACLQPGGLLILSNWRFTHHARMRRKIAPWPNAGIDPAALEPGDHLLTWQQQRSGVRYVHELEEAEITSLAAQAGLQPVEQFHADGREGDLSLYSVLRRVIAANR